MMGTTFLRKLLREFSLGHLETEGGIFCCPWFYAISVSFTENFTGNIKVQKLGIFTLIFYLELIKNGRGEFIFTLANEGACQEHSFRQNGTSKYALYRKIRGILGIMLADKSCDLLGF
jgi:hypothetical protein